MMPKAKTAKRWHWLITKHATSRMEVLTICLGIGGEALAVFSFEEEAKMFLDLRLAESGQGWRVRQTSVGELISILHGPCSNAKKVAMDPVPELGKRKLVGLPIVHRHDFLRLLVGEEEPSKLHLVASLAHRPLRTLERGYVA
jgi:hypothetical protein